MLTDDPGTPGAGMWEIALLSTMGRSREGWISQLPKVDLIRTPVRSLGNPTSRANG